MMEKIKINGIEIEGTPSFLFQIANKLIEKSGVSADVKTPKPTENKKISKKERDKKILALRDKGLSYREISEEMNLASTSIGNIIARARKIERGGEKKETRRRKNVDNTELEDKIIDMDKNGFSLTAIANHLNTSSSNIRLTLDRVKRRMTDTDKEFILANHDRLSAEEIAKRIGRYPSVVYKTIKELNN